MAMILSHLSLILYTVFDNTILFYSGGSYGDLAVTYSIQEVDIMTEATKDGSTVFSYFAAPAQGTPGGGGTPWNVQAQPNPLQVKV